MCYNVVDLLGLIKHEPEHKDLIRRYNRLIEPMLSLLKEAGEYEHDFGIARDNTKLDAQRIGNLPEIFLFFFFCLNEIKTGNKNKKYNCIWSV